ncbi:MAG: hypothetical protein WDK96_03595 [Candidatus Paceibacterota bacterium]|jgi:hypothetical protein
MPPEPVNGRHLFTIYSTGRNERGRTPFVEYHKEDGKITLRHGELIDSPLDYQAQREMNKIMEDVRRDFIVMSRRSEESAKECFLNA